MRNYRFLLQQALAGNKNAFDELVRRFHGFAHAIALRKLGDSHLAQDAVQEAFLAAHLGLPSLKSLEAFPSWFNRILIRCCAKVGREAARHRRVCGLDQAESIPDDHPSPLEIMTRFQDRAMVARMLAQLTGSDREACILRYQYGLSYGEIAARLGLPLGTLKRRLHTVRNKLVKLLEQEQGKLLRVGFLPVSDHLLAMVANERHRPNGMALRMKRFLSWSALVRALRNDLLDVAFIMAPLAMDLHAAGLGIHYVLDGHHDGSSVTVDARGVVAQTRSWRTKGTWALPYHVSTHRMLLHRLLGADSDPKESGPNAKYVSPSYIIRSLKQREVDAFFCSEPWGTRSEAEGSGRVVVRSKDILPGHICCVVVTTDKFSKNHADSLAQYLRQIREAGAFVRRHPDKAAQILCRHTGVDRSIARSVISPKHISFDELSPARDRLQTIHNLALESGMLKRPCDLDSFMLPII